ncbi:MAG: hypothetical protein IJS01_08420 [Lentisphaeria bacterium]|nr:hypothetical protein [Lentisphaeria bacterium]
MDPEKDRDGRGGNASPAEKKRELFLRQKALLETFLATGAITRAQHDKSLNCLIEKMGIEDSR